MPRSSGANKVVKKLPASENGHGVRCITKSGQEYFITHCLEKMRFTLWKNVDGGLEQIATAKSPMDLEDKVPWEQ